MRVQPDGGLVEDAIIQRMNDLLLRLRDKGNTVLVVEHKPEMIAIDGRWRAETLMTPEYGSMRP